MNLNHLSSMDELNKVMIQSYHETGKNQDLVYNEQTAEDAIRATSAAIVECLSRFPALRMAEIVRELARSMKMKGAEGTKET